MTTNKKSLFVAIVGMPNAGKSTLVNKMTGAKVSIVTPKVQTTRFRVRGIKSVKNTQLVFIDTPGIFKPTKKFDKTMVNEATSGIADAEAVLLMVDVTRRNTAAETIELIESLNIGKRQMALVLNKVDALEDKGEVLLITQALAEAHKFEQIFMISARTGDGTEDIEKWLLANARDGEWLYPDDQFTDISERLLATEITREKLFMQLRQELPYSLTVVTEKWEDLGKTAVKIWQNVIVERESHKKIILGAKGATLKKVGEDSRHEIGAMLGKKAHLFLHVKVKEDWKDKLPLGDPQQ